MKIGINGFGRIGRTIFRIAFDRGIEIVAVNDVYGAEDAAYLLKHDSVYGMYDKRIEVKGGDLIVGKKKIKIFSEREPEKIPWKQMGVDIVIESTGAFTDRAGATRHLVSGAKKVLITAPCKDKADITLIPGVNNENLKKEHNIISIASCTTNCTVPVLYVLGKNFGIERVSVTTIHAYTNDQMLQDSYHKKIRRGRAATLNIIPTSTGASDAVTEVLPYLEGKMDGLAIRVPVTVGSLIDVVALLSKEFDVKSVNDIFKKAAAGELNGILEYSEDSLVSSDIVKNSNSAIFDAPSTGKNGNFVKILAWYDNEYGYSCRVVDAVELLKKYVRKFF